MNLSFARESIRFARPINTSTISVATQKSSMYMYCGDNELSPAAGVYWISVFALDLCDFLKSTGISRRASRHNARFRCIFMRNAAVSDLFRKPFRSVQRTPRRCVTQHSEASRDVVSRQTLATGIDNTSSEMSSDCLSIRGHVIIDGTVED